MTKEAAIHQLKELDKDLCQRFKNHYDSVRKAFFSLDSDHDGKITVEDFLRNFDLNEKYDQLQKLL